VVNVVAAGDVRQRLVAGDAALVRRPLGWATEQHATAVRSNMSRMIPVSTGSTTILFLVQWLRFSTF
jgi:hypothetical protein